MLVYPKLPMPSKRESEPRMPSKFGRSSGGRFKLLVIGLVVGLAGGAIGGFVLRPHVLEDSELVDTKAALAKEKLATAEAMQQVAKLSDESKKLDEQRELLNKQVEAAKQAQDMVAGKEADASKLKADLDAAKKKLDATGAGTSTIEGTEIHLAIADSKLFKSGDELSPAGTKVLDKVAAALKDLADKQIVVQGHTDDQPPPKPAPPKPPKTKKDKTPPPPPPEPAFATNWELSSARALAVVHYLQDKHKLDATRLSVAAFSQYRPVSKTNRAANRRVELVLTTKPKK